GDVVVVVDVAGRVLALEVVEGAEQEVALLLERGEGVGIEGVAARPAGGGRVGHVSWRRRARSTSSRSSSVTWVGRGRHLRNTTTRAAAAAMAAVTGIAQTRLPTPDDG